MEKTTKRPYRRAAQYGSSCSVNFRSETTAAIAVLADQMDCSAAEVIRQCVDAGLPKVKDRLRKRADG